MAKLRRPAISDHATGALGQHIVYQQPPGPAIARVWRRPSGSHSPLQHHQTLAVHGAARLWRSLTLAETAAWRAAAPALLPGRALPTGYQAFMLCNVPLFRLSLPPVTAPPAGPPPPLPLDFTAAFGDDPDTWLLSWTPTPTGSFYEVQIAGPLSPGRLPRDRDFTFFALLPPDVDLPVSLSAPAEPGAYAFRVRAFDPASGLFSPFTTFASLTPGAPPPIILFPRTFALQAQTAASLPSSDIPWSDPQGALDPTSGFAYVGPGLETAPSAELQVSNFLPVGPYRLESPSSLHIVWRARFVGDPGVYAFLHVVELRLASRYWTDFAPVLLSDEWLTWQSDPLPFEDLDFAEVLQATLSVQAFEPAMEAGPGTVSLTYLGLRVHYTGED